MHSVHTIIVALLLAFLLSNCASRPHPSSAASPENSEADSQASSIKENDETIKDYAVKLKDHIKDFWVLPNSAEWDRKLKTEITLILRRDGEVLKKEVKSKSGNFRFDTFVMDTLRKASPFPPFPSEIQTQRLEFEMTFNR